MDKEIKFAPPTTRSFEVIINPIITEKSNKAQQESNKLTVKVSKSANKSEVKIAFESIFKVKVEKVNIINVLPRKKRVGKYKAGYVSGFKKAIITFPKGQTLDFLEGK